MHFRRERRNGVVVSLQETLEAGKEDSALTLSDVLQDGFCMEDACERQDEARRLRRLIEGLPARERKLILLRYGLAGQPPLTQLETAQCSRSAEVMSQGSRPTHWNICAKAGFKNHRENKGCRLRAAYISSFTMGLGVVY